MDSGVWAQLIYSGSFNFNPSGCNAEAKRNEQKNSSGNMKSRNEFFLVSGLDTLTVKVDKKVIEIDRNVAHSFTISKKEKRIYSFTQHNNSCKMVQTKRTLTFSSGIQYAYKKKTSKELILADSEGEIAVTAEYAFKYPVVSYKIFVYDKSDCPNW